MFRWCLMSITGLVNSASKQIRDSVRNRVDLEEGDFTETSFGVMADTTQIISQLNIGDFGELLVTACQIAKLLYKARSSKQSIVRLKKHVARLSLLTETVTEEEEKPPSLEVCLCWLRRSSDLLSTQ